MTQSTKEERVENREPWLKSRHLVALLGFVAFSLAGAYQMNMSVGIVAMVQPSASLQRTLRKSNACPGLVGGRNASERRYHSTSGNLDWSPEIQGYVLGSYYLSYVLVKIPAGILVERHGCKWFLFWGTTLAAIGTLAIPLASSIHAYLVMALQFLRGLVQGSYQPVTAILVANWFPKMERGFVYAFNFSGVSMGAFLGSIISGHLCESTFFGGWPSSFYASGIAGLVLSAVVAYFLHESPGVHPKISPVELQYILSNQDALSLRRPDVPWGEIFTSVPVYALMIGLFGYMWTASLFLAVNATFLGTILHYPIEEDGLLSAIPFPISVICTVASSSLSFFLTSRNYASVNAVRKLWNSLFALGFSACLLGVYFVGCDRHWSIVFSLISMGFVGIGTSGVEVVPIDMSPTFAASLGATCATFSCLPMFILPILVGYMTREEQTIEQWNKIFLISVGVVITSGVIFLFWGSSEVQPWNEADDKRSQRDKDKYLKF